ncbi:MAG: diguanylate cyclase [Marinospirillum sp.]|uniref:diguanylate cyclase domain-containing protein n=1 Tax=Marinospirillum sp. TaxID=2183934 RepID=UPI0019E54887|nr:diguanylate cyclase [Marinospirillum sp.]MBE0508472.1 diguanylate cyclase [Marinospirillum sp.]
MALTQSDLKSLIDLLETGLILVDTELNILLWNPWIARITDISEQQALNNKLNQVFSETVDPALLDALDQTREFRLSRRLSHQLHPPLLPLYQKNTGQRLHHSILLQPVTHNGQTACLLQISDVSSTVRREQHLRSAMEQVQHLAHHDVLTGLCNRSLLNIRLEDACSKAAVASQPFALFFIDLDGFKNINDVYGHDAGDALLQKLATRLQQAMNPQDTAARLGGDELIALMPSVTSAEQAIIVAEQLCNLLAQPLSWQKHQLQAGASIGVALWPEQGTSPNALLTSADNAMYLAKSRGKGQAVISTAIKKESTHQ